MFLGLKTATYRVPDIDKAKAWYAEALEIQPYCEAPFYVGFKIGDSELGLDPDLSEGNPGPGGAVAFWTVTGIESVIERFVGLGAGTVAPLQDVGGGVKVATLSDPFANSIGLIEFP